jgi:NAD-dependent deacetylase
MFSGTLLKILRSRGDVAVLTGAGISAESGIPTFRGDDGLWKKFRPEELARFDAFMQNPELVWEWYRYRREILTSARPNAAHLALAAMEQQHRSFTIITQNIDNLHQRAGSHTIHELHGNIMRDRCLQCGKYSANDYIQPPQGLPRCRLCGGLMRPDVVWFGEMLPEEEWSLSVRAAERANLFLVIGTSAVVQPAASLPVIAKRAGAYVVEINSERTPLSPHADEVLIGKAGEILPAIEATYGSSEE